MSKNLTHNLDGTMIGNHKLPCAIYRSPIAPRPASPGGKRRAFGKMVLGKGCSGAELPQHTPM
jgi:hypothetical protein